LSSGEQELSQPQGKASLSLAQSYHQALDNGLEKLKQYCQPVVKTPEAAQVQPETPPPVTLNPNCPNWTLIQPEVSPTPTPQTQASPLALLAWFSRPEPTPSPTPTPQALAPDPTDPAPFPDLHRQARLARVPIFMYHDILPRKEVFFDVTPQELEAHFQHLKKIGATPISADALLAHLRLGVPLPQKPVLLSFDDGYGGHFDYVYPLLKKYGYPAVFSIYIDKMKGKTARSSLTWEQVKILAADPLITFASHTVSHKDLRQLSDDQLFQEVVQSKQILEQQLGIPIKYFTYPEGKMDARVKQWVLAAGYQLAFSMNDNDEHYAGESPDLLTLGRFGQSRLREIASTAWGGPPAPVATNQFNFHSPIEKQNYTVNGVGIILISGGQPRSIHADSRYQVPEILKDTPAVAAVDGGFFSLKYLDSNTMIGPVLSEQQGFIPGYSGEIGKLKHRPLVLINAQGVAFVPFQPEAHNTLLGLQQASPALGGSVTDAFVGAAWLVRDNQPQPDKSFGDLFDFNAARHRAFWGLNQAGQPVIGVTKDPVGSVRLGRMLHQLGFRDAVMLDSGASTSLAYQGESLVAYTPRPVPHVVALFPPQPQALAKVPTPSEASK
jgi:peptidoglycan/xylan/chitin deacetylase (PgdA/CDA1 family)